MAAGSLSPRHCARLDYQCDYHCRVIDYNTHAIGSFFASIGGDGEGIDLSALGLDFDGGAEPPAADEPAGDTEA